MTASGSGCWLWQVTAMSNAGRVWPFRPCRAHTLPTYSPPVNRCRAPPGYGMYASGHRGLPVARRREGRPKQPCDSGRIYCLPVLSRVGYRFLSFDLLKEEISMAFSDFQSIEQVLAQYPLEVRQASFLSEIEAALPE